MELNHIISDLENLNVFLVNISNIEVQNTKITSTMYFIEYAIHRFRKFQQAFCNNCKGCKCCKCTTVGYGSVDEMIYDITYNSQNLLDSLRIMYSKMKKNKTAENSISHITQTKHFMSFVNYFINEINLITNNNCYFVHHMCF